MLPFVALTMTPRSARCKLLALPLSPLYSSSRHRNGPQGSAFCTGYYARACALKQLIQQFLRCGDSSVGKQIVSLGAGYDTTWFHLQASGTRNLRYIELDFQQVTKQKTATVTRSPELWKALEPLGPTVDPGFQLPASLLEYTTITIEVGSIVSDAFSLLPCDLRDSAALEAALKIGGLRPEALTLVLAECVLVYMPPEDSQAVVSSLGEVLPDAAFVIYEQIRPDDAFGKQMMLNLESRGCPLVGIHGTPDLERQRRRFTEHSWQRAWARDMDSIYKDSIPPDEKRRIERLEIFDELEEWHLIQEHYCIAVGVNDSKGLLHGFELPIYTPIQLAAGPRAIPRAD